MTVPEAAEEKTIVERLRKLGNELMGRPDLAGTLLMGSAALITRLREEAATIRQKTIEECAKVAEQWIEKEFSGTYSAEGIAKAIRAIDGGGKP